MTKKYSGEGNVIDVTLGADATSGIPIVVGKLLAVPITDGLNGETIACAISGVHMLPAVNGAAFVQGESIVWDISANGGVGRADDQGATPASGDLSLGCVSMSTVTAAADDELVPVKINVGPNTVT